MDYAGILAVLALLPVIFAIAWYWDRYEANL